MSFLVFIFILSILIVVHEWGHYITARKCGVKVDQFALGFGPRLFSWRRGGTEFCLCAIPLGGFVKMAGDERGQCTGAQEEFFSKPIGQRALIVLMGPVVNLVLAYVCFWAVFMIGHVDLERSAKQVEPRLGQVVQSSPAQKAGLKIGDRVISIDGTVITHWPDLQDYVSQSQTPFLSFVVERGGERITARVVPQEQIQTDIFGRTHKIRRIGVAPEQISSAKDMVVVRYGFFEAFARAGQELWSITTKTYKALYEMCVGVRSPKEAMGIVGMFFVIKFAISVGFSFALHIVGVISASLAIFNLLPIIPLDGGHLFVLLIEKIRGKALSSKADQIIARIGFAFIITLALFVFYVDFERIGLVDKVFNLFKAGS